MKINNMMGVKPVVFETFQIGVAIDHEDESGQDLVWGWPGKELGFTANQVFEIVTRVLESLTEDDLNRIYTGDYDKPLDESAKEIAKRIITEAQHD